MNKVRLHEKNEFHFKSQFGIECTEVRQPSLVDSFYIQHHDSPRDSIGVSVAHMNPLFMLFNQDRLDRLGPAAVEAWLKTMRETGSSSYSELKKKVSDDDLARMVKSRRIQAPCELEAYLRALNERADLFNSEVARIVAEQKAEAEAQTDKDAVNKVESQLK